MFDILGLFSRPKTETPEIQVLRYLEKTDKCFAPGALIHVEGGKALIYMQFMDDHEKDKSYLTLMFGEKSLFQLQGEEYYCPTCEKIIKTGYNLEQTEEFSGDAINSDNVTFEKYLEQIKPILGLLQDGYYCLWDTTLYPTDGDGELFWDYENGDSYKDSTCQYYFMNFKWGSEEPHFTVATQPFDKCNMERVEYYRKHPGARAIAYYMDGTITALIDGHHKALAAAIDHRPFNAVVISECYDSYINKNDQKGYWCSYSNGIKIEISKAWHDKWKAAGDNCIDPRAKRIGAITPAQSKRMGEVLDSKKLAAFYPTAAQQAAVDNIGEIDDKRLDDFICRNEVWKKSNTDILLMALSCKRSEKFLEMTDYVLHGATDVDEINKAVDTLVAWYDREKKMDADADAQIKEKLGAENLQDYLISYMADIEKEFPEVGKHVFEAI